MTSVRALMRRRERLGRSPNCVYAASSRCDLRARFPRRMTGTPVAVVLCASDRELFQARACSWSFCAHRRSTLSTMCFGRSSRSMPPSIFFVFFGGPADRMMRRGYQQDESSDPEAFCSTCRWDEIRVVVPVIEAIAGKRKFRMSLRLCGLLGYPSV